jgi:hypothetical protein
MNQWLDIAMGIFSSARLCLATKWKEWKWDNRSWILPRSMRINGFLYSYPRQKMWEWTTNLPYREINDEGREYLQRYFLKEFTWRGKTYIAYLHHFVGDDPARGPHSHRWNCWSFVLVGFYWEYYRWCTRKVRWFNRITPDTFHRIELDKECPLVRDLTCWTLFIHEAGKRIGHWGFWKELEDSENPNAALYIPYKYPNGEQSSEVKWWLTAPCRPRQKQLRDYL